MSEDKLLAKNIEVNLGKNKVGKFDVWFNKDGTLEIIPLNKWGESGNWSRVLSYSNYDYSLASRWIGIDEEDE